MKKTFLIYFYIVTTFVFATDFQNISDEESILDSPKIVLNSKGKAIATWEKNLDNKKTSIEFATSLDFGKTWSSPQSITESHKIREPKVIINESGNIICLWQRKIDDDNSILELAASYDFGKTWQIMQSDEIKHIINYSIKNINDTVFILWGKWKTFEKDIIYIKKSIDFGKTWGNPQYIETQDVPFFKFSLNKSGQGLITWKEWHWDPTKNSKFQINYSISDNFGEDWSEPNTICPNTHYYIEDIQSIIDNKGNIVIVWIGWKEDDNGENLSILLYYSNSSDNGKTWSKQTVIEEGNLSAYCDSPQIVLNPSGKMVLVWQVQAEKFSDEKDVIKIAISEDFGKTWSISKIISDESKDCFFPSIHSDSKEHLLISWNAIDIDDSTTLQTRYSQDFGIHWAPITDLAYEKSNLGYKIALNPDGNIILLLAQHENRKVKYQRAISSDFGKNWE
ncbi:MAG: hypothetical protein K940chlam1_00362 [Candidatus Anoxychlamydiales bacterium]|nr:hypothetical protein [Candidatus Anoxychlamydiales bacterium]NGX36053.1 hypothetical protein [Candidatus Anoxychlamydiales bacterium]